jgi:hypothetical protein
MKLFPYIGISAFKFDDSPDVIKSKISKASSFDMDQRPEPKGTYDTIYIYMTLNC